MNIQTVTELYITFRDSLKYRDSSVKKSRIKHTIREFAQFVGVSKKNGTNYRRGLYFLLKQKEHNCH